jgi:membrane protein DedA with SNARE-associated domain
MNLESIIGSAGYPAVFLLVMGECMGVPLPGETGLLIAAAAAGTGTFFNLWAVIGTAACGAIAGDTLGYWIGRRGGRVLVLAIIRRFGMAPAHFDKAERFFARHGGMAVFLGRSFSYLRVLTALLAGASRMRYSRFLVFNVLGGLVWAIMVGLAGFAFGRNLGVLEAWIREAGWGLLAAFVIVLAVWLLVRHRRAGSRRR